jgi:peptidoglycan/LPS O-acetylase OafA/YrhL
MLTVSCVDMCLRVSTTVQAERYNLKFGYDEPMAQLKDDWTKYDYAAYNSFGRLAYVLALAGMCALNASGNGGIVYGFLTLPFWEPMGKLTFGAYLIHPVLLRVYYYSQTEIIDFTKVNQTVIFVACATLGYALSMVTYVLIELPCDAGIKTLLGLNKRR